MTLRRSARQRLNPSRPVNWTYSGNRGLVARYQVLPLPGWSKGSIWNDAVAGALPPNNGTLNNFSYTSTSGWGGTTRPGGYGELRFDGVNDYVDLGNSATFNVSTVSFGAWIFPTAHTHDDWIVAKRNINRSFDLVISGGNMVFETETPRTYAAVAVAFGSLNEWAYWFATYDGTTMWLYKNGEPVGSAAQSGALATNTYPLRIGMDASELTPFEGHIDRVLIFNRVLAAAEIAADYQQSLAGDPDSLNWLPARAFPKVAAVPVCAEAAAIWQPTVLAQAVYQPSVLANAAYQPTVTVSASWVDCDQ